MWQLTSVLASPLLKVATDGHFGGSPECMMKSAHGRLNPKSSSPVNWVCCNRLEIGILGTLPATLICAEEEPHNKISDLLSYLIQPIGSRPLAAFTPHKRLALYPIRSPLTEYKYKCTCYVIPVCTSTCS
jgi:hypothetical protein